MTKVEIVPGTWEHAIALAEHMSPADRREVWAADHLTPAQAVRQSMAMSRRVWAGLIDGELACMFGVTDHGTALTTVGVPWMMATKVIRRNPSLFLRRCRPVVEEMKQGYDMLWNMADSRNKQTLKWLRWLGFEILAPVPYGPDGVPFHQFIMRVSDV